MIFNNIDNINQNILNISSLLKKKPENTSRIFRPQLTY